MTREQYETLMARCGTMCVNVLNYPTAKEIGKTPEGVRFTAWTIERLHNHDKWAAVGRYLLKDLQWNVEE